MATSWKTVALVGGAAAAAVLVLMKRQQTSSCSGTPQSSGQRVSSAPSPPVISFGDWIHIALGAKPGTSVLLNAVASMYLCADKKAEQALMKLFETTAGQRYGEAGKEEFLKDMYEGLDSCWQAYLCCNWDDIDAVLQANEVGDHHHEATALDQTKKSALWKHAKSGVMRDLIVKDLHAQRELQTMVDILHMTKKAKKAAEESHVTEDIKKAREIINSTAAPVILMLGGGMGAGKSTAVAQVMAQPFWQQCGHPCVIEADALKQSDVIFKALNELEHGDNSIAAFVHGHSTDAASKMLIAATSEKEDIILDGTCTWRPYVESTVEMVRNCLSFHYRMGRGWYKDEEGQHEEYWVRGQPRNGGSGGDLHYVVEMVAVTCKPELAVARGIRRKLITGRGVPVAPQLRSHRLFSENFESYLDTFDKVSLYDTSAKTPSLIAKKEPGGKLLVDPIPFQEFMDKQQIVDGAVNCSEVGCAIPEPFFNTSDKLKATLTQYLAK